MMEVEVEAAYAQVLGAHLELELGEEELGGHLAAVSVPVERLHAFPHLQRRLRQPY
jgi:hypothetical protein